MILYEFIADEYILNEGKYTIKSLEGSFAYAIDLPLKNFILKQAEWVKNNPDCLDATFQLDVKKARFFESGCQDRDEQIDWTRSTEFESRLDYYRHSIWEHPSQKYWDEDNWKYSGIKNVKLNISKNSFRIDFYYNNEEYYGAGLRFEDLSKPDEEFI